ncbi:MAG TPA: hypothetical protein VG798_00245 [Rhizomicrobium sp.]|nr:hypothetical protein [Rhizomicrobium sp.]
MAKKSPNRVTETDVAKAVMQVLAHEPDNEASIAKLVKEIPKHLKLSDEDRASSSTRKGEEMWEQQVRNITSHKATPGNFICEGYLEVVKGGLKLTEVGKAKLKR